MATSAVVCRMREALAGGLFLSSSASQRRFLVRLAGGETGGGDSGGGDSAAARVQAEAAGAMTGEGQAVSVAGAHLGQRRRRLRVSAAVACVVKRQKMVTS